MKDPSLPCADEELLPEEPDNNADKEIEPAVPATRSDAHTSIIHTVTGSNPYGRQRVLTQADRYRREQLRKETRRR